MSWTAIVLAGSRPGPDAFAQSLGSDLKALIAVGGVAMVRRVTDTLLASAGVGKIIVLAQATERVAEALPDDPRIAIRPSRGTIAETLLELIDDPELAWPLLVTTADHALLDPATVEEFCAAAQASDIAVGVVERRALLQRLPQTKRTWLRFRGGAYTGANLFALRSPAVATAIRLWCAVEQDRKKAWRIIARLGPLMLARVALRLATIDDVMARLGHKLVLKVKAVRLSNPLAGVDVDKAEDHALAEAILAGRA